jgi:hypothetical protein
VNRTDQLQSQIRGRCAVVGTFETSRPALKISVHWVNWKSSWQGETDVSDSEADIRDLDANA